MATHGIPLEGLAVKYAQQSQRLSYLTPEQDGDSINHAAVRAEYITPQDPIIITADGSRLPGVPLEEAERLNDLRDQIEADDAFRASHSPLDAVHESSKLLGGDLDDSWPSGASTPMRGDTIQKTSEGTLRRSMPPSRTNPLFPPMPLYGPPSFMRNLQCMTFRASSFVLSLAFLGIIVLGSAFTSIPLMLRHMWQRLTFQDPDAQRPFHRQERKLRVLRAEKEESWVKRKMRRRSMTYEEDSEDEAAHDGFVPTEGGKDPLVCDVAYYARRVGLDVEEFKVQTEDGFIITLWHVYNPVEFTPLTTEERAFRGPDIFTGEHASPRRCKTGQKPKFPILLMHGLLQSAGAYCTNDDDSLAFYLCKQGYDVWLGNNRCGFEPEHALLSYGDPRMWAWNIRQMGVMDLPALTSRVLSETGFAKLGLISHSQGTTQTFVALAKNQRPDLGERLTVFCALAPAAYAGPLIGKAYFKFMRVISPALFRLTFGIHAFIPFMMAMHRLLPGKLYGAMGYRVFSFLFNWTDDRWDRGLRDRMFQFSPVYVSAESMRWWLGRECFAKQKCILATREEARQEEVEDDEDEYWEKAKDDEQRDDGTTGHRSEGERRKMERKPKGSTAWYNEQAPPFAMWVAGSDDLVDGRRLLRRFERGREPYVDVVHTKIIEEYEHLDVIWAMDVIEQVGREIKEVLWKTCDVRDQVRVPLGCEDVEAWLPMKREKDDEEDAGQSSSSSGYERWDDV